MNWLRFSVLVFAASAITVTAWAGYKMTINASGHKSTPRSGGEIDTNNPSTTEEVSIVDAANFADGVVQHCASSSVSQELQEAAAELQDMIDNNRLCLENNKDTNTRSFASTMTRDAGTFSTAPPGSVDVEVEYGNGSPGMNINPAIVFPNPHLGHTALLSTFLIHEASHAAQAQGPNPNKMETREQRIASEKKAFEVDAEFICCAISYAQATGMPQGVIDVLCRRLRLTWTLYYCLYGGTNQLPDCGCTFSGSNYCNLSHAQNPPPVIQIVPTFPRPPVDPVSMAIRMAIWKAGSVLYTAILFPSQAIVEIERMDGLSSTVWSFDLSSQAQGSFLPLTMDRGRKGELYVAGRIEETGASVIYRLNAFWDGSSISISENVVYHGTDIGDITALDYNEDMSGNIVVFDFSMARVWYVHPSNGNITQVASHVQYPELQQVLGMDAYPGVDTNTGNLSSLAILLQPHLDIQFPNPSLGITTPVLVDYNGDGVVDLYEVFQ